MVNDELRKRFEESYYELADSKTDDFVGVSLGKIYIDIKKTRGIAGLLVVNYVYNDEVIKASTLDKIKVIENLIELSYYPETKLQELADNTEIKRKKRRLVEEINKNIGMANDEIDLLLDKIELYKKIYGNNDIENNIRFDDIRDKVTQIDSLIRNEGLKHG